MEKNWQLPLFAYGTLMFPEVIGSVVGRVPESQEGTLPGFRRHALKGKSFPGIFRTPENRVDGVLYSALSKEEWVRLNEFEDDFYELVEVRVTSSSGEAPALAYIIPETHVHLLEADGWDPEMFRQDTLKRFLTDHS